MKKIVVLAVLAAAAVSGACWYWNQGKTSDAQADLRLYGNVDIRQVSLAFEVPGRIKAVHADEGQGVKRGDLLAELDTTTLRLQAAQARARLEQAEQGLKKLQNGSRPEEIEQAKSMLQAAKARERKASTDYDIAAKLWKNTATRAVSTQQYESARNALDAAKAEVTAAEQTYRLARIGPRAEDIGAAAGLRDEALANLRLLEHQIELGSLRSPQDGIVRTRLLEAGDMASSTRAVYTLALMTPKWVRVYVSEPSLGRVKPGMKAAVYTDTDPGRAIAGSVGYISSVAEFTPKSVQTEELRTSLVYEVRVLVEDPADALRLGQPATVVLGRTP
jgi:HlyD family secretion protein